MPVVLNASLRALSVKASNKRLGVLGKNASRFTSLECFCEHGELNRQGGYRVSSRSGERQKVVGPVLATIGRTARRTTFRVNRLKGTVAN